MAFSAGWYLQWQCSAADWPCVARLVGASDHCRNNNHCHVGFTSWDNTILSPRRDVTSQDVTDETLKYTYWLQQYNYCSCSSPLDVLTWLWTVGLQCLTLHRWVYQFAACIWSRYEHETLSETKTLVLPAEIRTRRDVCMSRDRDVETETTTLAICPFIWCQNIGSRFFHFVAKHACDRQTNRPNFDSQDCASITLAFLCRVWKKTSRWCGQNHFHWTWDWQTTLGDLK